MLRLLNEPGFLRFIGDRGVKTIQDAVKYIEKGPVDSYRAFGHGLFLVETKSDAVPIGMCGVMRKPWLDGPDLAYAMLAEASGRGYASEAAAAVVSHAHRSVGLDRLIAIVVPDNAASKRVLQKLGFRADGRVTSPDGVELEHLVLELWPAGAASDL